MPLAPEVMTYGAFEGGQRAGDRKDDVQHQDGLDARQDDVLELLPLVGAVDFGRLVQRRIDRHHGADEQDHVLAEITPDRGAHQRPVVNALVFQPVCRLSSWNPHHWSTVSNTYPRV